MTAAEVEVEKPALREEHANAHDMPMTPSVIIRQVVSLGLVVFSVTIVVALMFTGNTRVADATNPWVALIVCVSVLSAQQVLIVVEAHQIRMFSNIHNILFLSSNTPTHTITRYQQHRHLPLSGFPWSRAAKHPLSVFLPLTPYCTRIHTLSRTKLPA